MNLYEVEDLMSCKGKEIEVTFDKIAATAKRQYFGAEDTAYFYMTSGKVTVFC